MSGQSAHTLTSYRVGTDAPKAYRLARTPEGELVLQGRLEWTEHSGDGTALCDGFDWVTLPTVQLPEAGSDPA